MPDPVAFRGGGHSVVRGQALHSSSSCYFCSFPALRPPGWLLPGLPSSFCRYLAQNRRRLRGSALEGGGSWVCKGRRELHCSWVAGGKRGAGEETRKKK